MIKLPDEVTKLMDEFKKNKYQIYVVGGAVRDATLKKNVDNWDFTTNAIPDEIRKLFPDSFYNNIYGTVSIPQDKIIFEITPFRKESNYSDSRHPEKIEWAKTVEEDLSRRDFTINAIAYDGKNIIDPYGGQKDLSNRLIKAVGDPDIRFKEDALRLLRAVRFTSQLGFLIEDTTRDSIQKNAGLITKISWERIRDEFLKILAGDHPSEGILFLKNT